MMTKDEALKMAIDLKLGDCLGNDDHIYRAWRKFEAYQVPVTEEGEYKMMRRWNAYKAGWLEALKEKNGL
jgi:hypothetical protein